MAGLAITLTAGLLDYYGAVDLRWLRRLDPVVNPGDIQFRLQSFFAHSGWLAEYVTLCAPYTLVILTLRVRFFARAAAIIALLLAGEIVLILSFQRGGWISYPLTLFAVWAAIYVTRRIESGETQILSAFRRSLWKVLVSLPLTVALSLTTLWALQRAGWFQSAAGFDLRSYVARAKEITRASDRSDFIRA